MSTTLVRDYIGEPRRVRVAGQIVAKRCAGMAGGPDEAAAGEAIRRLAESGKCGEADKAMWSWAWPGMRDHEIGVLVAWGGVSASALAEAVCNGRGAGYQAVRERVLRAARGCGLHGSIVCRREEELGPKAKECVRRVKIPMEKGDGCCWIDAGGNGARIGVPWSVVEKMQKQAGEDKRSHTEVKRPHHIPVWLTKGFAKPAEREGTLRVYEKGRSPGGRKGKPVSWGYAKWFYSNAAQSVDPMLDEWDQRDSRTIRVLREGGPDMHGAIQEVPWLLTKLVLRREATRRMLEETSTELQEGWKLLMEEEQRTQGSKERHIGRLRRGAAGLREVVEEDLRAQGVEESELDRRIEEWMADAAERAGKLDAALFVAAGPGGLEQAKREGLLDVKDYHINLLRKEADGGPFEKYCRDMSYGVSTCSEPILVLGDAVVVEGRAGYGKPHDPLEEPERKMDSVYLPLGKDRLLAGWRKGHEPRELGWILAAQARLARRSFIGADIANEYAEREQARIGECREGMNLARGYAMAREARDGRDRHAPVKGHRRGPGIESAEAHRGGSGRPGPGGRTEKGPQA